MTLWYIVIVLVMGILCGVVIPRLPTRTQRSQSDTTPNQLDDVDEMALWGEVTNDPFYKGE